MPQTCAPSAIPLRLHRFSQTTTRRQDPTIMTAHSRFQHSEFLSLRRSRRFARQPSARGALGVILLLLAAAVLLSLAVMFLPLSHPSTSLFAISSASPHHPSRPLTP
jgi:hypothetical protein